MWRTAFTLGRGIEFYRQLAHFKSAEDGGVRGLPKTSTGEVQQYVLRDRARDL
jgi:hypothetical protein